MERKRIKKRERPLVLALYFIFWAVALIMFGGLFVSQMESYNNLQAEITRLNTEISRAQAEKEQLEIQLSFFDSDAYLEQLARNMLGMVRPNEIVFKNIAD
ncbi:MAG: septum formation initiator family protein [Defluviitaleaceae bacterium]|nr:septum formation initiator family protein [Defluviitaleaceae bacterium]